MTSTHKLQEYKEWVDSVYKYERTIEDLLHYKDREIILEKVKNMKRAKNLKLNKLLIISENGYGDAIWHWRYIKELAKTVELYVLYPKCIIPLFEEDLKNNNITNIHLIDKISEDFEYFIMSFDLLNFFETYTTDKYLNIPYETKNTDKLKIGLALGNTDTEEGLIYRNVPRKWTKSFKKFDLYNFSSYNSRYKNVLEQCNNFLDTAKKLQEMDYIVCADNVILHLAGALGIKTYALFTPEYEPIWHNLNEENVGWYESVKPFICETENDWKPLIMKVKNLIENRNS